MYALNFSSTQRKYFSEPLNLCGLENVSCPVLVLCGEKDNVNKKAAIKIAEKLSRAKFSTIKNSGHEVNINNPKGLAKAMEELNVV